MLALAPINASHSKFIVSLAQDPKNAEFFRNFSPASMWPENAASLFNAGYVVIEEDKYVGLISICNIDSVVRQLEFGIVIACESRRSTMLAALTQLADYVFNYLNFNKMYVKVLPHRASLMHLMINRGFNIDGTLRQNVSYAGELVDEVLLSLLKKDYK